MYKCHLMRPLRAIRAGAVRFGQGDFSRPIAVRRRDELGDLAGQVNAMASGLQGMLDAKRQLLLAISHELRSPLTRARLNAELMPEDRNVSEEGRHARRLRVDRNRVGFHEGGVRRSRAKIADAPDRALARRVTSRA